MGAPKISSAGGGNAKPVADQFNNYLLNQLSTGGFQGRMSGQNNPSPLSFNTGMDINSDPQMMAMQQMLNQQQGFNVANLRERFAGPGSRGTPGGFAEASYLSQAAPQNILAMGQLASGIRGDNRADLAAQGQYDLTRMGLDQNVMQMLMGAMQQSNALGTPQAQNFARPSDFSQIMGGVAGLAPFALAPFTGGASLGLAGMMGGMGGGGGAMESMGNIANAGMSGLRPNPMWGG